MRTVRCSDCRALWGVYLPRGVPAGGVPAQRMYLLGVYLPRGCVPASGDLPEGVPAQGGVYLPGGRCTYLGVYLPGGWGVPAQEVYLPGGGGTCWGCVPAWGGVPGQGAVPGQEVYLARGCTCPGGVPARGTCPGGVPSRGKRYLPGGVPAGKGVYLPGGVYLPRVCTCLGTCWGVSAWGVTYQGVYPPRRCTYPGGVPAQGVYLPGGVPAQGCTCLGGGGTCLGVYLLARGMYLPGGVSQHALRQIPLPPP